ncbi:MAG: AI-2E family transporter [Candidatus Saccharimonadales bacterium]
MKVRIEIDTKTFVRFWLVVMGFAVAILAVYSARTALVILGVSFFLALALNGPVTKLASILPGRSRVGGTAIAYVAVMAFLGMFLFLLVPPIIEQTAKVVGTIPTLVDDIQTQWHGVDDVIHRYHLEPQVDGALNSIKDNAASWAANAGQTVVASLGSIFAVLTSALLVFVLTFLMLIEGPMWLQRIWHVYNDEARMERHKRLTDRMYSVVTGYVTGQLAVSGIGGIFAGFFVFVLHFIFPAVPVNLALPTVAIAFVLSLIPMFGATIAGILIAILLAFNDVTAAIVFVVYFIVYQQIENNFVSPTIQSKTVELSALAVLGSVTVGLYVFGVAGGIISIPIAGCIKVLLEDYLERAKANRKKSETPMHKLVKKLHKEA